MRFPPHLNCVALIETTLGPLALLYRVLEIEAEGARQRIERWGPRTIDIDLLIYLEADNVKSQHSPSCAGHATHYEKVSPPKLGPGEQVSPHSWGPEGELLPQVRRRGASSSPKVRRRGASSSPKVGSRGRSF